VDVGVHQDGLVHISAMTSHFISDPRMVVKAGDIVRVKVIEVDEKRRRISLSMKLESEKKPAVKVKPMQKSTNKLQSQSTYKKKVVVPVKKPAAKKAVFNTAMADALSKLK